MPDNTSPQSCDLAVIGGGSGGVGAAIAAARLGLDVVLVEKGDRLGGNSVRGGVHCWEMGAGGTGIPFDLYKRIKRIPHAIGIYSYGRHILWHKPDREPYPFPGGEQIVDPDRRYLDTLQRHGSTGMRDNEAWVRQHWHGVPFEPDAMAQAMHDALIETGNARVLLNTAFTRVHMSPDGQRIASLELDDGQSLQARFYVDSTADGLLCAAANCTLIAGQESRATYNEPSAPDEANDHINGVSLVYRITPAAPGSPNTPSVEPLPEGIPTDCWWREQFPVVSMNHYPNGDRNMNMLPTMEGGEFASIPYAEAYAECRRRVLAHWHHFQQTYEEFRHFRITWIAPGLGVRESRRVVAEYMLTEHDLLAGVNGQSHNDMICIADHARDTHGASTGRAGCGELVEPYGVPFRCLVPKDRPNLMIACRAAGFTSIAASSCRLSRTMIQLGQACGAAAALAVEHQQDDIRRVDPSALRESLREQYVQLEHPMPDHLREHLANEDA